MLDSFCSSLGLEVVFAGRGRVTLSSYSVLRPGLQFAGYFNYFDSSRILVIGNSEYEFLRDLAPEVRRERVDKLFSYHDIPCIIFSRDLPVPQEILGAVRKTGCPVLRTDKVTTTIMNDLFFYLNKKLAPSVTIHGVLMDISGVGILITGHSGVGKSETAMELIKRGHRLVADDSVIIKRVSDSLVGTSPELIRYFMELRGIASSTSKICTAPAPSSTKRRSTSSWSWKIGWRARSTTASATAPCTRTILGMQVMKHVIPVKPGRNLSIIIEVAARNFRLKSMGYDAAQELIGRTIGR